MYHHLVKQGNCRQLQHTRLKFKQTVREYFIFIIALRELLFGRNTYKYIVFYIGCFYFCFPDKRHPNAPLDALPALHHSPRVREV